MISAKATYTDTPIEHLFGIDFDDKLVKVAKICMLIAGDGKATILHTNSLDIREWQNSSAASRVGTFAKDAKDGKFDLVLTNPPFSGKITGRSKLSAYDLYELALAGDLGDDEDSGSVTRRTVNSMKRDVLFLERSLDLLKPGGRMAIVLPQGNLNNLGAAGLRRYMTDRARLLAVIGLDFFTFRPFASIKTSVVFLQKWGGSLGPPVDDYDVFMAVSRSPRKDSRGNHIHRRDATGAILDRDGTRVVDSGQSAEIDHDLAEIADAFLAWGQAEGLPFLK